MSPSTTSPARKRQPTRRRCHWARDPLDVEYHDREWGVPVRDDRVLFEFLILEGAQAGLSWSTILRKRAAYRRAFAAYSSTASTSEARSLCRVAKPAVFCSVFSSM